MDQNTLSFEEKIALLASTPPGPKKHELIQKFASNDTQFFKAINSSTMPLNQYMQLNYIEFSAVAAEAKVIRDNTKNRGWTEKKYQKLLAHLPERLVNERPEFSSQLPNKVLAKNIKVFLETYPQFKI